MQSPPDRMPRSEKAERILLAGLMRAHDLVIPECERFGVTAGDFYWHRHRLVFEICHGLPQCNHEPTAANVYSVLRGLGEDGPGLPLWLADTLDLDPTGWDCLRSIEEVKRYAARRLDIRRAREIEADALTNESRYYIPQINLMEKVI